MTLRKIVSAIVIAAALLVAPLLITGSADAKAVVGNINPYEVYQEPERPKQVLPAKGATIEVNQVYGCKQLPDLSAYMSQRSAEEAERFFFWKRMDNLACASIEGVLKVLSYSGRMKAGDGTLRCIIQVELYDVRSNRDLRYFLGWKIYDPRIEKECTP